MLSHPWSSVEPTVLFNCQTQREDALGGLRVGEPGLAAHQVPRESRCTRSDRACSAGNQQPLETLSTLAATTSHPLVAAHLGFSCPQPNQHNGGCPSGSKKRAERIAEKELTDRNWDQDDEAEECNGGGAFKRCEGLVAPSGGEGLPGLAAGPGGKPWGDRRTETV